MSLGLAQPLTEMSTMNHPWSKGRTLDKADNLTAICEPTGYIMCEPQCHTALRASTACYGECSMITQIFQWLYGPGIDWTFDKN
jgi:hypothetical protein